MLIKAMFRAMFWELEYHFYVENNQSNNIAIVLL